MVTITFKDENLPFSQREFDNFEDFLEIAFTVKLEKEWQKAIKTDDFVEL